MTKKERLLLGLDKFFQASKIKKIFVKEGMFFFETNTGETIPVVSEDGEFNRKDLDDELRHVIEQGNLQLLQILRDCEVVGSYLDGTKRVLEIEATTEFWNLAMELDNDELYALGADDADFRCRIVDEGDKMYVVYGDIEKGCTISFPITDAENANFWRNGSLQY